jgi:hypothetical protein
MERSLSIDDNSVFFLHFFFLYFWYVNTCDILLFSELKSLAELLKKSMFPLKKKYFDILALKHLGLYVNLLADFPLDAWRVRSAETCDVRSRDTSFGRGL